jgi:hypothetical protein
VLLQSTQFDRWVRIEFPKDGEEKPILNLINQGQFPIIILKSPKKETSWVVFYTSVKTSLNVEFGLDTAHYLSRADTGRYNMRKNLSILLDSHNMIQNFAAL